MAVPDYQTLMLPLLKLLSDGREHRFAESKACLMSLVSRERRESCDFRVDKAASSTIVWDGHGLTY